MLFKLWITSYFASNHNNNETCGLNHVIMAHWQGFSVGNSALEPLTSGSAFYHKYFRLLWFHEKPFEYPLKVLMCIGFLFQFGLKLFGNWQKKKSLSEFTVQHSFSVYLYLFSYFASVLSFLYHPSWLCKNLTHILFSKAQHLAPLILQWVFLALDNYIKV